MNFMYKIYSHCIFNCFNEGKEISSFGFMLDLLRKAQVAYVSVIVGLKALQDVDSEALQFFVVFS